MQIVRLKPKSRSRIPRRPHPDLDDLFGRYALSEREVDEETGSEATEPRTVAFTA